MSTGKILLGILAGAAAGAALGILFAPDKGSNTRKKISKEAEDYTDELKSKFNDLLAGVAQKFDSVKQEASGMADKGKSKYEEAKKEFKNGIQERQTV